MRGNANPNKLPVFKWSKDHVEQVFNAGGALMAISTVDEGRYLEVNKTFLKVLGYSRDEVIGRTSVELGIIDPRDRAKRLEDLMGGNRGHAEMKFCCKDGSIRYGLFSSAPLELDGCPCWLTIMSDITDRKISDDILRESEKRFRWITSGLTDYLYTVKVRDGRALETTHGAACERVTGYTADDFRNDPDLWLRMVVEEDREHIIARVREILAGIKIPPIEHRIVRKDGKIRWVVDTPILHFDENGQLESYDGVIKDITERKQTEEIVLLERDFTQATIDTLPGLFYLFDDQGRLLRWNKNFEVVSGYSAEELSKMSPLDFFKEPDRTIVGERIQEVFTKGHSTVEADFVSKSRTRTPHCFTGKLFKFEGRLCVIGTGLDISERKEAEKEIYRLNAELEQRVALRTAQLEAANRELESFSYSISHDLRSPLRGIDGWSQALMEDYGDKLDKQGHTYINRVRAEAIRMGNLIDALLQLSRMARINLSRNDVNLSEIACSIAVKLKETAPGRSVEFIIQPGMVVTGDAQLLEAALANLLGNAFKFTGKRDHACIEFCQAEMQGSRAFFVRDNGEGFDVSYSKKLFRAFQRMHKVSEFPGTGIGLATVKRIILRHGGRVWAESGVGLGATFYFTLGDNE